jgi:hypothetical protein
MQRALTASCFAGYFHSTASFAVGFSGAKLLRVFVIDKL